MLSLACVFCGIWSTNFFLQKSNHCSTALLSKAETSLLVVQYHRYLQAFEKCESCNIEFATCFQCQKNAFEISAVTDSILNQYINTSTKTCTLSIYEEEVFCGCLCWVALHSF